MQSGTEVTRATPQNLKVLTSLPHRIVCSLINALLRKALGISTSGTSRHHTYTFLPRFRTRDVPRLDTFVGSELGKARYICARFISGINKRRLTVRCWKETNEV